MPFTAGKLYTNSQGNLYGTDKGSVTTNKQYASGPTMTWFCKSVSKVFAVFKSKSGGPNGTIHRLPIYTDALGDFVFPRGRFDGAPIFLA
jgi:hypothetical protein